MGLREEPASEPDEVRERIARLHAALDAHKSSVELLHKRIAAREATIAVLSETVNREWKYQVEAQETAAKKIESVRRDMEARESIRYEIYSALYALWRAVAAEQEVSPEGANEIIMSAAMQQAKRAIDKYHE